MTGLAKHLADRITHGGPITVADYMGLCLMHPTLGYYSRRDPFGAAGDFVTAPEISQMFGELLGLCLAQAWLDQGAPSPFVLAELGPGRGTLMADLLRATRHVPGLHAAAQVCLVEASGHLRQVQAETLAPWVETLGSSPVWADTVEDLPDLPLFLIANEFFDALPIRQFQRLDGWHERLVGLAGGGLALGLSPPVGRVLAGPAFADCPRGGIVEICPAGQRIAAAIGARLRQRGGAALIIDYGDWRSRGDTLQALYRHAPDDVLAHPGEADLTAHVDFEALVHAAGVPSTGLTAQGDLLRRLGIDQRAQVLAKGLSGMALIQHKAALARLTGAAEMGTLFKAIALTATGAALPGGFDPSQDH